MLQDLFDETRLAFRKQRRGYLKDSEIGTAVKYACKEFYNDLLREYRNSRQIPNSLDPFRVSETANFSASTTFAVSGFTAPFGELISATQATEPKRIGIIYTDDEWADVVNSSLLDAEDTFMRVNGSDLESNQTLSTVEVSFIQRPTSWFAFTSTPDGDGRGTTLTAITEPLFKEDDSSKILAKVFVFLGLSLQDQGAVQIGAAKENKYAN